MQLSAFNLYFADYPEPGQTLIYNTFSGGFAVLESPLLDTLRRADKAAPLPATNQAAIDPTLFDENVGILVENRATEELGFRQWFETRRSKTDVLEAIISTTFACNFDCTYCCQNDVLNGKMMKDSTGKATAWWLISRAREIGAKRLDFYFVGGEPLLHPRRLEQIVTDVRQALVPEGVDITFGVITNGLFLTRELVEKWVPLGMTNAQVTLDGDETTHAITRRSKKREDTFPTIFQNVIDTADLIELTIKGNYQHDTAHGFLPLIQKLKAAGLPKTARIRFSPAVTALGAPSDSASGSCNWSGSNPELMLLFTDEIRRAGYDAGNPMEVGPCAFHLRHHYAIDPDGHIYKCPGFLGHPDWAIGHVTSGLTSRYDGLANINPQRQCGTCAHRPHCAGGCVAAEWLKQGRAEGVNCEINYLETFKDDLVKRQYALATTDSVEEALRLFPTREVEIPRPQEAPWMHASGRKPAALRVLAA